MWKSNSPGANPVCIVGAGFPFAVLDASLPSTSNIIAESLSTSRNEFPILARLNRLLPSLDLNFVWTNSRSIANVWQSVKPEIVNAYKNVSNIPMRLLANGIENEGWFLLVLLEYELKRMLALHYDHSNLKLKTPLPRGLTDFLDATKATGVIWISLNYDLCLETVLQQSAGAQAWRYAYESLLKPGSTLIPNASAHDIIKPHGSLNIWFATVWQSRILGSTKWDVHQLFFADSADRLKTCSFTEIGYIPGTNPPEEKRPCLIGYLPEELKVELNSPAVYSDIAHDLCKWNVSYATLVLQNASSIYVLGYSMPYQDEWIWQRFAALRGKNLPIYVASKSDTNRIVETFRSCGFVNAQELSDGGVM